MSNMLGVTKKILNSKSRNSTEKKLVPYLTFVINFYLLFEKINVLTSHACENSSLVYTFTCYRVEKFGGSQKTVRK